MKKIKQNILLIAFVWSLLSLSNQPIFAAIGNKTSEADTVRVLTIGNSFANNACRFLEEIAGSVEGCVIIIGRANLGGHSLEQHASYIKQSEEDPDFKAYARGTKSLKDFLIEEEWDAVTIQQVSPLSFVSESFQPYADEIVDHVKEHSPNSQIYIHQTWAYAPDAPRLGNLGITYEEMYEKLTANYLELSERYDEAPILRSGDAFYNSYEMNNEIDLWNADDRFHASLEGSYLGGCVWFSELFKKDPSMITFIPDGMSEETAKHLKEAAISVSRYDSISVQGVSIHSCPSDTLFKNGTYQLNASVFPYNAGEQSVTWSSSNPAVATVDTTGLVNALSEGISTITVTTHEGGFTDVCEVEVMQKIISVD